MSITNSKTNNLFQEILLCVYIFITPIIFDNKLLDIALNYRFLICSILLIPIFLLEKPKINFITLIFIIFYCYNLVSVLWARCDSEAMFESQRCFLFIAGYIIFYSILTDETLSKILKTINLLSLFLIIVGIFQISKLSIITNKSLYEISGLQCHKNLFSNFLFLLLPFNIINYLKSKTNFFKKLSLINIVGILTLIICLQTRAVYVGLIVCICTILGVGYLYLKQSLKFSILKLTVIIIAIISCTLIIYYSKGYFNTKNTLVENMIKTDSNNERLSLITKTISIIKENYLIGVGAGNWQVEYAKFGLSGLDNAQNKNVTFQRPHNDFLWILSELGIFAFLLYVFIIVFTIYKSCNFLKNINNSVEHKLDVLILLSFYIGFMTISFFDFPKERIEHLVFHALLLACIHRMIISKFHEIPLINNSPKAIGLIVCIILIFNTYIGYKRYNGEINLVKAYHARQTGNWYELIKYCKKAKSKYYSIDPTSIPIDWYEGVGHFSLSNHKEAFNLFKSAYELSPYNFHVVNNLASSYENNGNSEKAVFYYNEALKINPTFDEAKLNLAAIYYNQGNIKKAYNITINCGNSPRKGLYLKIFKENLR